MKMHHRSSSSSSRRTVEFVLLILSLCQSTLGQLVSLSSATERAALFDLRSSLGLRSRDWPRKANPCSAWIGVQCRQDGRVEGINLSGLRRTRLGRLNPQFSVDSFVNLTVLASFNASRFSLPGPIPDWFGQRLVSLQVLDLRSCSVNGTIPSTLGQLSRLSVLDLSSNFLSGSIPPSVGALSNLQRLNLSNNRISGLIPIQLGDLSRLLDLDLSLNSLSGLLPQDLRGLRSLKKMMISRNNLSGDLPVLLWSMNELVFLDVAYNNFTGILPNQSLNANVTAAVFNLSHNQFYGILTSHIERFSFIDLSDNYVQGRVTDESRRNASLIHNCLQNVLNQKSLEECTLFYSSRGLSFDNFGGPNTTQPPEQGPKGNNNRRLAFILAGVFVGLGFIVLLVLMLILCLRSRQRRNGLGSVPTGGDPKPEGISINFSSVGEEFTYEQLVRATIDFSDSNLIKHGHSGDLFRGVFEGGISVVIKRIDVRSFKKESYTVELDLFRRASHARLVPLLGHCLEHENEKLVVYKYMPNGDLSNSLYRKTKQEDHNLQSLDWITRLKIAIGAAEGLSYLHHECNPPLVHRDVQASSILLDDKFEVRLGSLSEVCTQEGDTHQNVITRLFRLSQSSDQGSSGLVPATCAYDVYCFGKVLLELVTGKLGISASNDATMNEWLEHTLPNISIYEKELVTNIVDPSLIVDDDLLEEVWAMAVVAKSCLNPKPSKRPLMRYILKALENPSKVVREESLNSARLRTSSRGSWSASYFGSWRRSSSEIVTIPGLSNQDGANIVRPSGLVGSGLDFSSSNKRLSSSDVFPEPIDMPDIERL